MPLIDIAPFEILNPMHWSTYERKRERAEIARERSLGFLADWLDRTKPAWRRSAVDTARG